MKAEILSIIAIIISIGVPCVQFIYNKWLNTVNIENKYYDEIFKEYLIKKIPECRVKLQRVNSGEIKGVEDFIELLRELRKQSLYFKFANNDFYLELLEYIQNLEDVLVLIDDVVEADTYNDFLMKVDSKVYNIYDCILSESHGRFLG